MKTRFSFLLFVILLAAFARPAAVWARLKIGPAAAQVSPGPTIFPSTVQEGNDFATQVLNDPWDMDAYSDVSWYINSSNVETHLTNMAVSNSIFSAVTQSDPQFFTLFPGYPLSLDTLNIPGQFGITHPIPSAVYSCFSMRLRVDTGDTGDNIRIYWFANESLGGQYGITHALPITDTNWHLYETDLSTDFDPANANTPWDNLALWEGLRIDPSRSPGHPIYVDWVRLTNCAPVETTLSWTAPGGSYEIWAGVGAASPDFMIAQGITSTLYTIDVQGWQPGTYYFGVRPLVGGPLEWTATPLTIDPAPLLTFTTPAYDSGETLSWEMNSVSDLYLNDTRCANYSFSNGLLDITTLPPSSLPGGCVQTGASDPQFGLALPTATFDPTTYRYLSLRVYSDGDVGDVNHGWVMRWLWRYYLNNNPAQWCIVISNDVAYDVGWHTYLLDLLEITALVEEHAGPSCIGSGDWDDAPINWLRFDPNENTTNSSFHQLVDWIRLSRMDSVAQGNPYDIHLEGSEDLGGLFLTFFYTTDPANNPTQNLAQLIERPIPAGGPFLIYLPTVMLDPAPGEGGGFTWDTSAVPLGIYYICVIAYDGYNTTTRCSLAPVEIISPPVDLDVTVRPTTTAQGHDFAAQVLGDAWDMNQSTDLRDNTAASGVHLTNIQFSNGILTADTLDTDSQFYPLFPPTEPFPPPPGPAIDPTTYHCLYLRMSVENGDDIFDELRAWWFTDYSLAAGDFGYTQRIAPIGPTWTIYTMDLNAVDDPSGDPWALHAWQTFRIDPTTRAGIPFHVDWVRLTDCAAIEVTLTWAPVTGNVDIWAGKGGQSQDILVASLIDGATGTANLDIQGWEAGTYYLGVKDYNTNTIYWTTTPLQITP